MKTLSTIYAAAVLATTFAIPAWADLVGMERTASKAQANAAQTQVDCGHQLLNGRFPFGGDRESRCGDSRGHRELHQPPALAAAWGR
jgi:hypothetical protein